LPITGEGGKKTGEKEKWERGCQAKHGNSGMETSTHTWRPPETFLKQDEYRIRKPPKDRGGRCGKSKILMKNAPRTIVLQNERK